MLARQRHGGGAGRKLLIAHGLFGSARNWGGVAKALGTGREVVAVDMRNHGRSFRDAVMDYPAMAADLAAVIRAEGGRMDVLGHSMGGKAAMALAVTEPDLVGRLVVGDIAPVRYDHSHAGLIDAMEAVDLSAVARRGDAEVQLAGLVEDRGIRAFLLQSLETGTGPARWRLNLPVLRASMPTLVDFPDLGGAFGGPALFVSGSTSDYVGDGARPAIRRLFPRARLVTLKGAGHWLHADSPDAFARTVAAFLDA